MNCKNFHITSLDLYVFIHCNYKITANILMKAAQLGHVESAYNLVNFYMDGIAGALPVIPRDALVKLKKLK